MGKEALKSACRTLIGHYTADKWWPARSRFEVMVGAVLVQNTRWSNASLAIKRLKNARCLNPQAMDGCTLPRLESLIHSAGCQRVKSIRLASLVRWLISTGGVRRVAMIETSELRSQLMAVNGIGPETADVILCFAFARPVFIADQYARRWLLRMGLTTSDKMMTYESCREHLECLNWSGEACQKLHAAIVLHGQAVCGRVPDCGQCALKGQCIYNKNNKI